MVRDCTPTTVYWLDNKLYLNITNKCSNQCYFCIRNLRTGIGEFTLKLNPEPTLQQVTDDLEKAIRIRKWEEIIFCGFGEPTEKLDLLLRTTHWLKQRQPNQTRIRLNTNGQGSILNPKQQVPKELKTAGIDKVSISLNAQNETIYSEVCRPKLQNAYQSIIEFINQSKQELETEITVVTIPEISINKTQKLADQMNIKLRIRPYNPGFY
jgi:cyclic pyranopterin phosphate synthase